MSGENNSHPPRITSKRIGNRAPIAGTLKLGFTSFIPLLRKTIMLATIPNHPIICARVRKKLIFSGYGYINVVYQIKTKSN